MVTSTGHETNDKVQAAGKNLLLYIFSLMKTGELHDLNNEAGFDRRKSSSSH